MKEVFLVFVGICIGGYIVKKKDEGRALEAENSFLKEKLKEADKKKEG